MGATRSPSESWATSTESIWWVRILRGSPSPPPPKNILEDEHGTHSMHTLHRASYSYLVGRCSQQFQLTSWTTGTSIWIGGWGGRLIRRTHLNWTTIALSPAPTAMRIYLLCYVGSWGVQLVYTVIVCLRIIWIRMIGLSCIPLVINPTTTLLHPSIIQFMPHVHAMELLEPSTMARSISLVVVTVMNVSMTCGHSVWLPICGVT